MKFTRIKLFSMVFAGLSIVSAPVALTLANMEGSDNVIYVGGEKFVSRTALDAHIKKNYGHETKESSERLYYLGKDGKKAYLSNEEIRRIYNVTDYKESDIKPENNDQKPEDIDLRKAEEASIFSSIADIETNLIDKSVGELSPKWFSKTQVNAGDLVKIWRGNDDVAIVENKIEAIDTYINSGHEVFYFNDIYFKNQQDLYDYLTEVYFNPNNPIQPQITSLRIKAPNGNFSKLITLGDKTKNDWRIQASNFIKENCRVSLKVRTGSDGSVKYLNLTDGNANYIETFLDQNIKVEDIPFYEVDTNREQNWVVGFNAGDQRDFAGPTFYSGNTNLGKGWKNSENWQRLEQNFTPNYNDKEREILSKSVSAFFGQYIDEKFNDKMLKDVVGADKSGKTDKELNAYVSDATLLFSEASTGRNVDGYYLENTVARELGDDYSITIKGENVGSYDENNNPEDIDIPLSEMISSRVGYRNSSLSQLSTRYREMFYGTTYQWIYDDAINALNNYATMSKYDSILKIPLLYNFIMSRLIKAGAPNNFLTTTQEYFGFVADTYTNIAKIQIGTESMQPLPSKESFGELDFRSLFNIDSTKLDFKVEKYGAALLDVYPTFIVSSLIYGDYAEKTDVGLGSAYSDELHGKLDQFIKDFFSGYNAADIAAIKQAGDRAIANIMSPKSRNSSLNPSAIEIANKDSSGFTAYTLVRNNQLNTTNRDNILERIESQATELLNAHDKWELVPNDNQFKSFAYYIQETTGETVLPKDFLTIVNVFDPNSLLAWNNAFLQLNEYLVDGRDFFETGISNPDEQLNQIANVISKKSLNYTTNISHEKTIYEAEQIKKMNDNFKNVYFGEGGSLNQNTIFSGVYLSFEEFVAINVMKMLGDLAQRNTLFTYDEDRGCLAINPEYRHDATMIAVNLYNERPDIIVQLSHLYRSFQTIQQAIDANLIDYMNLGENETQWGLGADVVKMIIQNTAQYSSILNTNMEYFKTKLAEINVPTRQGQIIAYSGTSMEFKDQDPAVIKYEPNLTREESIFSEDSQIATDMVTMIPNLGSDPTTYVIPNMEIVNGEVISSKIAAEHYLFPVEMIDSFELVNKNEYSFEKYLDMNLLSELKIKRDIKLTDANLYFNRELKFSSNQIDSVDGDYIYVRKWPAEGEVFHAKSTAKNARSLGKSPNTSNDSYELGDAVSQAYITFGGAYASKLAEDVKIINTDLTIHEDQYEFFGLEKTKKMDINNVLDEVQGLLDGLSQSQSSESQKTYSLTKNAPSNSNESTVVANPTIQTRAPGKPLPQLNANFYNENVRPPAPDGFTVTGFIENDAGEKLYIAEHNSSPDLQVYATYRKERAKWVYILNPDVRSGSELPMLHYDETTNKWVERVLDSKDKTYTTKQVYKKWKKENNKKGFKTKVLKGFDPANTIFLDNTGNPSVGNGSINPDGSVHNNSKISINPATEAQSPETGLRAYQDAANNSDVADSRRSSLAAQTGNELSNERVSNANVDTSGELPKDAKGKELRKSKIKGQNIESSVKQRLSSKEAFNLAKRTITQGTGFIPFYPDVADDGTFKNAYYKWKVEKVAKDGLRDFSAITNKSLSGTLGLSYSEIEDILAFNKNGQFKPGSPAFKEMQTKGIKFLQNLVENYNAAKISSITSLTQDGFDQHLLDLAMHGDKTMELEGKWKSVIDYNSQIFDDTQNKFWETVAKKYHNGSINGDIKKYTQIAWEQLYKLDANSKHGKVLTNKSFNDWFDKHFANDIKKPISVNTKASTVLDIDMFSDISHFRKAGSLVDMKISDMLSETYYMSRLTSTAINNSHAILNNKELVALGNHMRERSIQITRLIDSGDIDAPLMKKLDVMRKHYDGLVSSIDNYITSWSDKLVRKDVAGNITKFEKKLLTKRFADTNILHSVEDVMNKVKASHVKVSSEVDAGFKLSNKAIDSTIVSKIPGQIESISTGQGLLGFGQQMLAAPTELHDWFDAGINNGNPDLDGPDGPNSSSKNSLSKKEKHKTWHKIKEFNNNINDPTKWKGHKWARRIGKISHALGVANLAITAVMLVITIYQVVKMYNYYQAPVTYTFKTEDAEWTWSGITYKNQMGQYDDSSVKAITFAKNAMANEPIKINSAFAQDVYYYDGVQYSRSDDGKLQMKKAYIKSLMTNTSSVADFVYTFNAGDNLVIAENETEESMNRRGFFESKEELVDSVIGDVQIQGEHSKFVSDAIRSYSDKYIGSYDSQIDNPIQIAELLIQRIRPTIYALRPELENNILVRRRSNVSQLPGQTYDPTHNKVIPVSKMMEMDPTYDPNNYMVDDSANYLNGKTNSFAIPNPTQAKAKAMNNLRNANINLYTNNVASLTTFYNANVVDEVSQKKTPFSDASNAVENGARPIQVIKYDDPRFGTKYFVGTYNHYLRTFEESATDNLIQFIQTSYGIKTEVTTYSNIVYYIDGYKFNTLEEVYDHLLRTQEHQKMFWQL